MPLNAAMTGSSVLPDASAHELHLRTAAVGGNINSKPGQKQGRSKDDRNDLLSHHDPSQTARRFPSPVSMINNRRPEMQQIF